MARLVLAGVAAIALLFGGSILLLVRLTEDPARPGAAAAAPSPVQLPAPAPLDASGLPPVQPPGGAPQPVALSPRVVSTPRPVVYDTPPPAPPPGSWEAVPVTAKAKALGQVGAAVSRALVGLKDELRACFQADVASRHGGAAVTSSADTFTPDETGQTGLVLQLELQRDAVRVADAPVETRGDASEETIACAQALLRGRIFKVPGAVAGERARLRYVLTP